MSETHTKSFEYFDLEVEVTDAGDVNVIYRFPEAFEMPDVVEYRDTREAIESPA